MSSALHKHCFHSFLADDLETVTHQLENVMATFSTSRTSKWHWTVDKHTHTQTNLNKLYQVTCITYYALIVVK